MQGEDKNNLILMLFVVAVFTAGLINWFYKTFKPQELDNLLSGSAIVVLLLLMVYSKHSSPAKPAKK